MSQTIEEKAQALIDWSYKYIPNSGSVSREISCSYALSLITVYEVISELEELKKFRLGKDFTALINGRIKVWKKIRNEIESKQKINNYD